MRSEPFVGAAGSFRAGIVRPGLSKGVSQGAMTAILVVAMLAFEVFNFDTTRYALHNLLGDASFSGIRWAAILALAFCAIDFAGLAYLCAPEREQDAGQATWYLMGAWLLGATMNALMTWWALNLTLLSHSFGNEVLSREQILELVPPFVAALVWLTRILFIGAFSISGDPALDGERLAEAPFRLSPPGPVATGARSGAGPSLSAPVRPSAVTITPREPAPPRSNRPMPRPPLPTMVGARTGQR